MMNMPVFHLHHGFEDKNTTMQTAVKLIAPVSEIANAEYGIRTHVFEEEECKGYTKKKKVRLKLT